MGQALWKIVPGRGMVSEVSAGLRLSVVPTVAPRSVRFVVEGRVARNGLPTPLLSGYRESVEAAMRAAEDAAGRMGRS